MKQLLLITIAAVVLVGCGEPQEVKDIQLRQASIGGNIEAAKVLIAVVYFPNSKFGKKLSTDSTVGDLGIDHSLLINKTGTTFTDLRPSGKATIDDQRLHVVTEGTFIEKDNPIRVISTEGNRIVVRKI